jgi:adenylate cyclase
VSAEERFEAAGLLEGLSAKDREARLGLLQELDQAGVPMEELQDAAAAGRLALLPVERVFRRDAEYTLNDLLERSGVDLDFMRRDFRALGRSMPDLDEREFTEEDLASAAGLKQLLDAGVPEEGMLTLARVMGRASAQLAETIMEVFGETFVRPGDTEHDVGLRFAQLAEGLTPALGPLVETPVRWQLRELARREVVIKADLEAGALPDSREVAVCFGDLSGFTSLTERAATGELDQVVRQLEACASDVAEPPVRLIKLIGDAAMLVAPDPAALINAAAELRDRVEEDEALPPLRVGAAYGSAMNRFGDWYGRPVNLASRVCGAAGVGSVTGTAELVERTEDRFDWVEAGTAELKGIDQPVALYQLQGPA